MKKFRSKRDALWNFKKKSNALSLLRFAVKMRVKFVRHFQTQMNLVQMKYKGYIDNSR